VGAVAAPLPRGGVILDAANGLGLQDEVIAALVTPRHLIALNLSETQLRVGRPALSRAGASPVVLDAVRLPFADRSVDGAISVEAPFHFRLTPCLLHRGPAGSALGRHPYNFRRHGRAPPADAIGMAVRSQSASLLGAGASRPGER